MMLSKDINTIVPLSGGFESMCAAWYAKKNNLNPVAFHVLNQEAAPYTARPQLAAAQKQAEYFDMQLIVDESTIPQVVGVHNQNYPVLQAMSVLAMLVAGNPHIQFKYVVYGANMEDSFRQRLQLRFPMRAVMASQSSQLDMHGVNPDIIAKAPKNIFPFEHLTKSEMIAMIHQSDKELLDMVWCCTGQTGTGRIVIKDNKPCGKCTKCHEWKSARTVAWKSIFKRQEGHIDRGI